MSVKETDEKEAHGPEMTFNVEVRTLPICGMQLRWDRPTGPWGSNGGP
jgi:hypothetical protein